MPNLFPTDSNETGLSDASPSAEAWSNDNPPWKLTAAPFFHMGATGSSTNHFGVFNCFWPSKELYSKISKSGQIQPSSSPSDRPADFAKA